MQNSAKPYIKERDRQREGERDQPGLIKERSNIKKWQNTDKIYTVSFQKW